MTTKDVARAAKRGPYAKSEERRQTILDAAHAVFAARGYRGGSLQDVADRAGMSQTSLLHYFPSKRDLLMSVLERRDEITSGAFPDDMEEGLADSVIRTALYNEDIPGVIELYTVLCAESVTDEHPGRDYFTERYERLRGARVARVVVPLVGAACGACFTTVPLNRRSQIRAGNAIDWCESCGVILYYADEQGG